MRQVIPSLEQRTPEDHAILIKGGGRLSRMDPLLSLGLAAWSWREGWRDEAAEQVKDLALNRLTEPVKFYANWLTAQIDAERAIAKANEALTNNAPAEASKQLQGVGQGYVLMPFLAKNLQALRTELVQDAAVTNAEKILKAGQRETAVLLLESLRDGNSSPRIVHRIDQLLERARAEK